MCILPTDDRYHDAYGDHDDDNEGSDGRFLAVSLAIAVFVAACTITLVLLGDWELAFGISGTALVANVMLGDDE